MSDLKSPPKPKVGNLRKFTQLLTCNWTGAQAGWVISEIKLIWLESRIRSLLVFALQDRISPPGADLSLKNEPTGTR